MSQQTAATLATIFSDVLADLAFMFTDEEHNDPNPEEVWVETAIGYRGSSSGDLRFRCPRPFTALLAANLLGASEDDPDAENSADDAAKEFMNIVCGQLVTALHGTQDVFNLTIPELQVLDEAPDLTLDDGENCSTISVEGHRIQLAYTPQ
ncbi:MAG: chemotaxis protein CheX [Phycisphaerales bacterium]|nr:chemotaxis protein CheX [Phycisphaerales bacterium]